MYCLCSLTADSNPVLSLIVDEFNVKDLSSHNFSFAKKAFYKEPEEFVRMANRGGPIRQKLADHGLTYTMSLNMEG